MSKSNELKVNGIELPQLLLGIPSVDNDSRIKEYHVSHEEAVRLVKRSHGRAFYVRCNQFAPSRNQDGVPADSTRGRDVTGNVETTRRGALRFLENTYTARTREECYVRVALADNCLFIG